MKYQELDQGPCGIWLVKGGSGSLIIHATARNMLTEGTKKVSNHNFSAVTHLKKLFVIFFRFMWQPRRQTFVRRSFVKLQQVSSSSCQCHRRSYSQTQAQIITTY